MIYDSIKNAECYYGLGGDFRKALEYLKNTDRSAIVPGQRYQIDENIGFTLGKVECKAPDDDFYEAHREYADIQLVVSGCEYMGVADIAKLKMREDFKPGGDIAWYTGKGSMLKFEADDFAIFFPQDAHMPCRNDGVNECSSMKLVIKIKL